MRSTSKGAIAIFLFAVAAFGAVVLLLTIPGGWALIRVLTVALPVVAPLVFLGSYLLLHLGVFLWWVFFSDVMERYQDGSKKAQGAFHSGDKQGLWTYWYPSGRKQCEGRFVAGWQDGEWSFWRENGQLRARGVIGIDGFKEGLWQYGDTDGTDLKEDDYVAQFGLADGEPRRKSDQQVMA